MQEAWEWEGQIVEGKFPLRLYLGGSQQSAVFLTEYNRPESQHAAIKLVAIDSANTELQLFRWKLGADLSHPHLVRIFEMGRARLSDIGLFYVVMEYAQENLSEVLRHRALTPEEACDMLDPAADALAYLHGKGLVHGRLKPANIMAVNDQLKVSSDGLYRAGERSGRPEKPNAYDPPEIAQGMSPAGDVWSLGVTLVEALTQRPPVREQPEQEEPVLPNTISPPIVDIAHHCLKRDHWLRWTAADIVTRLRKISAEGLGEGTRAPEAISKRHYVALAVILGVALGVVFGPRLVNRRQGAPQETTRSASILKQPSAPPESPPATSSPGEVLHQALPDVPAQIRNGISGTVRVRVRARVDPSGSVVGTTLDSAGPSKYFAERALQAARLWKFKAPNVNGRDVSSEWLLRFTFSKSRTMVVPLQADP